MDRARSPLATLRPGADHEEARAHLERQGWQLCGAGDWAIALRSPDGGSAARISPFDPTAPFTAALYRDGRSTGWFPRLDEELALDGGANVLVMEFLEPVDEAVGRAVHRRLRAPDAELEVVAELIRRHHRSAQEALPWCGPVDDNPANVMRTPSGTIRISDPYYADGPALFGALEADPLLVARTIEPGDRRHLLDIPLSGSGGRDERLRESMRRGLAAADALLRREARSGVGD